MAPVKVTFKTVQGNKFELELDSAEKVWRFIVPDFRGAALPFPS